MKRIGGGGMLCVLGTGNVGVHAFRRKINCRMGWGFERVLGEDGMSFLVIHI